MIYYNLYKLKLCLLMNIIFITIINIFFHWLLSVFNFLIQKMCYLLYWSLNIFYYFLYFLLYVLKLIFVNFLLQKKTNQNITHHIQIAFCINISFDFFYFQNCTMKFFLIFMLICFMLKGTATHLTQLTHVHPNK